MARSLEALQKQYNTRAASASSGPFRGPRGRRPMGGKPKNTRHTVRRLMGYIGRYRLHLVLATLCMLINVGASLIGGYMLAPIVDHLTAAVTGYTPAMNAAEAAIDRAITAFMNTPPMAALSEAITAVPVYILAAALILFGVYAVGMLAIYCQDRLMMTVSQGAVERIRNDLFGKLQELPVAYFDSHSTGELMSRFTNDVDNIDTMLNNALSSAISGVITVLGTLVFMCTTSWVLTLVTLAFVPLFVWGGRFITRRSNRYYLGQQAALGSVNGYMEETISGQKVVKTFNHEATCIKEFATLNDELRDKQFKANFYGSIMGPIMGNTGQLSYAATVGIGGILICTGWLTPGGLTVFSNYSRQFSQPINRIAMQTSTVLAALAGAERVFAVMDARPEPADALHPAPADGIRGRVELKDVTFGYTPDKTVLHGITLSVEPGQKIAFVGSTGAGKTTVTNLLSRFYDIDSGSITLDGADLKAYALKDLRRHIAMVLQDTHLFSGTVMDNIRYGRPDATDEEVIAAAKSASAHGFICQLADGYQTRLEGDGGNLSQGQRQLLNIARAALSRAPILVLDEATSSVDTLTERHIETGMDRLMRNRTTFIIAHRLSTVRHADQILVLEQGQIMERGTHRELLERKGRYYELYTGKRELA